MTGFYFSVWSESEGIRAGTVADATQIEAMYKGKEFMLSDHIQELINAKYGTLEQRQAKLERELKSKAALRAFDASSIIGSATMAAADGNIEWLADQVKALATMVEHLIEVTMELEGIKVEKVED